MSFLSIPALRSRLFRQPVRRTQDSRAVRLGTEPLEDRTVPATITVTSLLDNVTDDNDVTLREAIQSINNGADLNDEVGANRVGAYGNNDTIVFQAGLTGTITLGGTQLALTKSMTITGPGQAVITVDGNATSRVFSVDDGAAGPSIFTITGLTINNGTSTSGGGLFNQDETLNLTGVTISNSVADQGGGLFSAGGTVTITDSTVSGNKANTVNANEGGGGINNQGTLVLSNVTVSGNMVPNGTADGGGLFNAGTATITGGSFTGNMSTRAGGGIETQPGSTLSVIRTVFDMNTANKNGGAVHLSGAATATLSGVTVRNNVALEEGGGLWNSKTGTLTISDAGGNVLISGNVAKGDVGTAPNFTDLQGGGGIFNDGDGGAGTGGTLMILDTSTANSFVISGNTATGATKGSGGGLLSIGGMVTIAGVNFDTNEAVRAGGGIEAVSGTLVIDDTVFMANDVSDVAGTILTAAPGNGGAIHTTNTGTTTITNSVFTGNSAKNEGGALWNSANGTMMVTNTTIDTNTAKFGGGVFQDGAAATGLITIRSSTVSNNTATTLGGGVQVEDGQIDIINSTVSGNTSQGDGGGIAIGPIGGTLNLVNSTVAKNTATTSGGGVDQPIGTFNTVSSIIALNTAPTGPDVDGTANSTGNNLFGNTAGTTIAGGTNDLTNVDPVVGPLANNGGPTQTHALLTGSPALNTGSNPQALTTDQRGGAFARTFGSGTDIGAFEAQPITSQTVLTAAPTSAGPGQPVVLTATVTVPGGVSMPTGTVTFINTTTGATLGTASLMNGIATLTVTTLTAGTNAITATYGGDVNAAMSTSAPVSVTVAAFFARGSAFGSGGGGGTAILRATDGTTLQTLTPFGSSFTGGVRVAAGDFNNDGTPDLVVGNGPGIASKVVVVNGKTGATIFSVNPFEAGFTGGVFVAAGDINADGIPELIITPDQGGGPRVRVFDGASFGLIADFFGITDPDFRGGARAGVADLNGDGIGDLIVSAGFQGGPRVAVWNGTSIATGSTPTKLINDIFVFEATLRNGAFVTGADINGDGFAELIAGAGPGGGPRVVAFDGKALLNGQQQQVSSFFAGDSNNRNGVPVAVADFDGNGAPDLLTGTGEPLPGTPGTPSPATVYPVTGLSAASPTPLAMFEPFPGFTGGVFVG